MFRWYANARKCYAYLSDIGHHHDRSQLNESRWFTRGWTLQELIAPANVTFYDRNWRSIGDKAHMLEDLHKITRIDGKVLRDRKALQLMSVAKRMSWAADRMTSRVEDRAYSLLGIFDVNMPMLYGEGEKPSKGCKKKSSGHRRLLIIQYSHGHHHVWSFTRQPSAPIRPSCSPRLQMGSGMLKILLVGHCRNPRLSNFHNGV